MPKSRRPYGTGGITRTADGRWRGQVEAGYVDGKRRRKTISRKTKAEAVAALNELNRRKLTHDVPAGRTPTLEQWLRTWLTDVVPPRVAPGTLRVHTVNVDQHIVPHLGHLRLDKLRPPHILRWHQELRAAGLSGSTILRAHAVLTKALTDAKRLGYLAGDNPAQLVDRPKPGTREPAHLDLDQARLLLRAVADHPYGSRWAMALLTGQRQGEILGLQWRYVDLDRRTADIAWKLERLKAAPIYVDHDHLEDGYYLTRPKAGVRKMVPLTAPLVAWLRRHRDENPPGRHDLVWTRDGGPISADWDYGQWVQLLRDLGLPRVPLHSARHTCVSLLLSLGEQEATIMQYVGHSSITTARGYQHLPPEARLAAADRLGAALELEG